MRFQADTVILDFDDTLYDWVGQWHASFSAMLAEISKISGIPEHELKPSIRRVHQDHHTSEYSFLIEAIPELHVGENSAMLGRYGPAIVAFKEQRDKHLRLFPDVLSTLKTLKAAGKCIVVFTESQLFYSKMRFKRFELDGLIDYLYTSSDKVSLEDQLVIQRRAHGPDFYELRHTRENSIRPGRLKPEPEVLLQIIAEVGSTASRSLYVGDSLFKDVLMANQAGVRGVWARYGASRDRDQYSLLREVSHWTDADIQREKDLATHDVSPDATLENGFWELLDLMGIKHGKHAAAPIA